MPRPKDLRKGDLIKLDEGRHRILWIGPHEMAGGLYEVCTDRRPAGVSLHPDQDVKRISKGRGGRG